MTKITAELLPLYALPLDEAKLFTDWVWQARKINMFDPEVLKAPRAAMVRAVNEQGPLLFVPLQPVLMLESLAPKPGLTPRQEAMSLWRVGEAVEGAAKLCGFQEVVFMTRDDRVADICAEHGFEELKGVRVLKKKIKLETAPAAESQAPEKEAANAHHN